MVKFLKADHTKCWQGYEQTGILLHAGGNKMFQTLWKIF